MNFYIPHRRTLNDSAGLAVERGSPDAPDVVESFGPGDVLPDYILGPRPISTSLGGSLTVTRDVGISALIRQGMGNVHMATCREFNPFL
ncbi:putative adhesin [Streptomyces sp. NPDC050804]|uniref:putative adhesin n=1 Tax=Streptomyces sp. NPDC050804 TaxID=3154745 RepID=UPI003446324D